MKDYLLDIVEHTHKLGGINLVKIKGTTEKTVLDSFDEVSKLVVINGTFKNPVPEFIGTFGMPNLSLLDTILHIPEYAEDAKITMTKKDNKDIDGIRFENKSGDFKNDYRLMSEAIIDAKLASFALKSPKWTVDFVPSAANIMKFKYQSQANSEEKNFTAKTENEKLKFYFGDHSTHAGEFVFETNITGKLDKPWRWPIAVFIGVLSLSGNKRIRFNNDTGAVMISVDSGLIDYDYILPAITK